MPRRSQQVRTAKIELTFEPGELPRKLRELATELVDARDDIAVRPRDPVEVKLRRRETGVVIDPENPRVMTRRCLDGEAVITLRVLPADVPEPDLPPVSQ